jgi:hypothetical protein
MIILCNMTINIYSRCATRTSPGAIGILSVDVALAIPTMSCWKWGSLPRVFQFSWPQLIQKISLAAELPHIYHHRLFIYRLICLDLLQRLSSSPVTSRLSIYIASVFQSGPTTTRLSQMEIGNRTIWNYVLR